MTKQAYNTHFRILKKHYKKIICVNLLCHRKPGERSLVKRFEEMIKECALSHVKYVWFDFHKRCPGK